MLYANQEKISNISEKSAASIFKVGYSSSHRMEEAGSLEMLEPLQNYTAPHIIENSNFQYKVEVDMAYFKELSSAVA
jgi:hypothetical protein